MTTIVYKAWKYIAADRRWVGGEKGWNDNSQKIFTLKGPVYDIYLLSSGIVQMPEKMDQLLNIFKDEFDPTKLYDVQEELKKTNQWNSFWFLFVYHEKNTPNTRCWKLGNACLEEADTHYAAYGSWSDYIDGIMLIKPDIDIGEMFRLVSSKDIYTSEVYDVVKFETFNINDLPF